MGVLEIRKYPDSLLRKMCEPVEGITLKEAELFNDMVSTMQLSQGIGLAAPQVGISKRLIVVNSGKGIIRLANPTVVESKGKDVMKEGCLSVPDINVEVKRPFEIVVAWMDENGKVVETKLNGLPARIVLHEIDHLNGKLIVDYMGFFERLKLKSGLGKPR